MKNKELRDKIDAINLKHMHNTGWNGHKEAEVYQAAMDEIVNLVTAEVERADQKSLETIASLLNGDDNQVEVVQGYIRNKLLMYAKLQPQPKKGSHE
jgi:hypothetical protein